MAGRRGFLSHRACQRVIIIPESPGYTELYILPSTFRSDVSAGTSAAAVSRDPVGIPFLRREFCRQIMRTRPSLCRAGSVREAALN